MRSVRVHTKRDVKETYICEMREMRLIKRPTDVGLFESHLSRESLSYEVATISRLLKIIGFFCKRDL